MGRRPKRPPPTVQMKRERWRPIIGYEGYYEVSDMGNVRSIKVRFFRTKKYPYLINRQLDQHGYEKVCMSIKSKRRYRFIHQLVLESFGVQKTGDQVRHLNGIRHDNRLKNLKWGNAKQNAADRHSHGKTAWGSRNFFAKLTEHQVMKIKKLLAKGHPQVAIAKRFEISQSSVSLIHVNKSWKHVRIK